MQGAASSPVAHGPRAMRSRARGIAAGDPGRHRAVSK
jgi:hypothetical protein